MKIISGISFYHPLAIFELGTTKYQKSIEKRQNLSEKLYAEKTSTLS